MYSRAVDSCRQLLILHRLSGGVARKRRRRSNNFVAIKVAGSQAIGALSDNVVLKNSLTSGLLTEDLFVISAEFSASISGLTAGEGHPMTVGCSHSDYTVAQILENLDNEMLGPGNKIEQEQSRRSVRTAGPMHSEGGLAGSATDLVLIGSDGSRIPRMKCKFLVSSGKTLDIWVWNRSGAALTTGSTLRWAGTIYGRWLI